MEESAKNTIVSFTEKIKIWFYDFVEMLPNIVLAVIILILAVLLTGVIKRFSKNIFKRIIRNRSVANLLGTLVTVLFFGISFFLVLNILNLEQAVTSLLAGAGIVGLAVGLAFQDPLMNTISGIIMSTRAPYALGDLVESNGFFGTIEQINLRTMHLRQLTGEMVIIPNKSVIQNPLTNFTCTGHRRIDLVCGISYGDDLRKVQKVVKEAVRDQVPIDKERDVEVFFKEFGDSSINFVCRFWIGQVNQVDFLKAQSDAIIAIKDAFDENDITIPFPIRTLDFGIKGGERLDTVLEGAGMLAQGKQGAEEANIKGNANGSEK